MFHAIRAYLDSLAERLIQQRLDDSLAASLTQVIHQQLDAIDIDRLVAEAVQHIDWTDHIDWHQLACHLDIDYTDLCRYIEIDAGELAEELKDKIRLAVHIQ